MSKLVYSAIASLDGYVADEQGHFDWAAPDNVVHAFINDLERSIGIYLYGRRMYQTMVNWETIALEGQPAVVREYAEIWRAADKIVYSSNLEEPASARTRIERTFDPEAVRRLKEEAGRDLSLGGPELAAHAIDAGLIDELHLFLVPVLLGGGKRALSQTAREELELLDQHCFRSGFAHLHYRIVDKPAP